MHFTRWYDQDNYARLLINTLEHADSNVQSELANDIIQIIMQSGYYTDLDSLINAINDHYISSRRRWYDQDETMHSAIEILRLINKNFNENIRKTIIQEFAYSLTSSQESIRLLEGKG